MWDFEVDVADCTQARNISERAGKGARGGKREYQGKDKINSPTSLFNTDKTNSHLYIHHYLLFFFKPYPPCQYLPFPSRFSQTSLYLAVMGNAECFERFGESSYVVRLEI